MATPAMLLIYRYKLMPTWAQYRELDRILEGQRLLYNAVLQERTEAWRKAKVSISKIDQNKSLTKIRAQDETYRTIHVILSRWSIARGDDAMKSFFGRVKRGSKKRDSYDSNPCPDGEASAFPSGSDSD